MHHTILYISIPIAKYSETFLPARKLPVFFFLFVQMNKNSICQIAVQDVLGKNIYGSNLQVLCFLEFNMPQFLEHS